MRISRKKMLAHELGRLWKFLASKLLAVPVPAKPSCSSRSQTNLICRLSDILAINWSQNSSQIAQLLSLQLNRYVFRAYL